jgi:hypothetical protein
MALWHLLGGTCHTLDQALHITNGATDMRKVLVSYLLYFEPDTGISISFFGEKIHCLVFGFSNEKKNVFVFFVFSSIQPNILCIK